MQRLSYGLLLVVVMASSACNDGLLVKPPPDQISEANFWRTSDDAVKFVNGMYRDALGYEMVFWDAFTDNAYMGVTWHSSIAIGNGTYDPTHDTPSSIWSGRYSGIRKVNVFLNNVDKVEDLDSALKERLIGEARFLRALFYHDLVRFFGGVPLITEPQGLDSTDVPRASKEKVVDFILQDLAAAAKALPLEYDDAANVGRATKGAALALKSRVLLYNERWAEAAAAAKAVMDLGVYELFPNYGTLFQPENENNSEVIFDKQYVSDRYASGMDTWNQPNSFGWGGLNPLQSLVDDYEMIDGKSIEKSPKYDPAHPYENRDPRFYATVVYDDVEYNGKIIDTSPNQVPDGIGSDRDATKTGYYMRKHLIENYDDLGLGSFNSPTNWILFRYGEVLLNYAEAKNEVAGPVPSVYAAVNKIRARVDLPPLEPGLSKAQMRKAIHHERRIELAFEGHRYHDIRRWGIVDEIMPGWVYGMKVDGEHVKVEERVWMPKLKLFPIPQSEMDVNAKLKQNPGW